jgi:hypothetical protein
MLSTCSSCRGFVPPSVSSCPNCGSKKPAFGLSSSGLLRGVFAAATGGVTALTLMACYGIAPCGDGDCGAGGNGTGGSGTGGSGTTTTTTGTGGTGGGTACSPCSDVATKLGTKSDALCAADKATFEALVACACTTSCSADCGADTCAGKDISAACQTCIDTSCQAEKAACLPK